MNRIIFIAVVLVLLTACSAAAREKPLDVAFEAADANHDNLISNEEWHAALQRRFEAIDKNHDGRLSREELQESRETLRERFKSRLKSTP